MKLYVGIPPREYRTVVKRPLRIYTEFIFKLDPLWFWLVPSGLDFCIT